MYVYVYVYMHICIGEIAVDMEGELLLTHVSSSSYDTLHYYRRDCGGHGRGGSAASAADLGYTHTHTRTSAASAADLGCACPDAVIPYFTLLTSLYSLYLAPTVR